ncbi:hypothetical protein EVAR_48657_1 [Eumeta japonica]|uniref:Uncharacterized protein n=1 Tax=Eumeta variegata TaxID=151549 RepID=A0A4C1XBF2_EUMVA|nr:hypothetical protein EVAR_48657_1 [Eumeta japonica]
MSDAVRAEPERVSARHTAGRGVMYNDLETMASQLIRRLAGKNNIGSEVIGMTSEFRYVSSFSKEKAMRAGSLILIKNNIEYKERPDIASSKRPEGTAVPTARRSGTLPGYPDVIITSG